MAIKCRLSALMGEHRYNIEAVHKKTGIARSAVSKLYHDKSSGMDFATLNKLCKLFGCLPSDILDYSDDDEADGTE